MSVAVRAVLFNEELSEKIFFDYQDHRTVQSIKNMIEVARCCKHEHNMPSYQLWLSDLKQKVVRFECDLEQIVQDIQFDKLCSGMNECVHEEKTNYFVCLSIIRLVKTQQPTGFMQHGIVTSIARSMKYWKQNIKMQNYWMYCLLTVHSSLWHIENNGLIYKHTYPIMEEVNKYDIREILQTGIVDALLFSIHQWPSTDFTQESAMKILYKIFAECHEFRSEDTIVEDLPNTLDREISTTLKRKMAAIILGTLPPIMVIKEIWDYQMILLLFLLRTTLATTDVEWSSFTSLKLTLVDARRKNQHVVLKLIQAGAIPYLIRALQTLVNEASDPKNICQTMLVLGQLFFGNSANECEMNIAAYVSTLLKLYNNFDKIFRDCDNEIPRFNGVWLYNTTIYYLVVILQEIITKHPSAMSWLDKDIHKFTVDSSVLKSRILHDSSRMQVCTLLSVIEKLNPCTETLIKNIQSWKV
jgi:hypothetical protein